MGVVTGLLTMILFVYLAIQHKRIRNRLKFLEILTKLNQKGIDRLSGKWVNFPDAGVEFKDEVHPYASDLDLFGQGSIFQWINSAQTPGGREALQNILKEPLMKRQEVAGCSTPPSRSRSANPYGGIW